MLHKSFTPPRRRRSQRVHERLDVDEIARTVRSQLVEKLFGEAPERAVCDPVRRRLVVKVGAQPRGSAAGRLRQEKHVARGIGDERKERRHRPDEIRFDPESVDRIAGRLAVILAGAAARPGATVAELPLLEIGRASCRERVLYTV